MTGRITQSARFASVWIIALRILLSACSPQAMTPTQPATPAASPDPEPEPEASLPAPGSSGALVVYSGRSEELVGPIIKVFENETGIDVQVRYGDTAELAATILEEGSRSPADVYFAQDAGALGALAQAGRLQQLADDLLSAVEPRFRSPDGLWVGLSGRARVVVYNTDKLAPTDLPDSIWGFTDPKWNGKIGWAPTNGSFQAFVTALRVIEGEDRARKWLLGVQANNPKVYERNTAIVDAVAKGEIEVGFVNHYYLFRFLKEQGDAFPARNYFFPAGDIGNLINVAGAGILDTSKNVEAAEAFIRFMLSAQAQTYFAEQTTEYPLVEGIPIDPRLMPLSQIDKPNIDLSNLDDLDGTLQLLQELGIL
ncbi:MAG: extracellular solute-binding protein [Anaerolineae bacterium]